MRTAAHVLSAAAVAGLAAAAPAPQAFEFAEIMTAPKVALMGPPLAAISQMPSDVVPTAALIASVQAEITTAATAAITGAAASNAANMAPPVSKRSLGKRGLEKRDLLANILSLLGARFNQGNNAQAAAATSTPAAAARVAATVPAAGAATGSAGDGTTLPSINIKQNVAAATTSSPAAAAAAAQQTANSANSANSSNDDDSDDDSPDEPANNNLPAWLTSKSSTTSTGSPTGTSDTSTACPTTPEDGTYCGFINPEDPCAPQPDGYGPNVTQPDDTPQAFMNYAPFQAMAKAAVTPNGYIQTFRAMNASASATSYMGLWTINKYDPSICAKQCDAVAGCTSFNLFIERDPSVNPCRNDSTDPTVWGYWCPNPPSITNYKCTLWGSNLEPSVVVNTGGWRRDFAVVITGSNGYDKTNVTTPVLVAPPVDPIDVTTPGSTAAASTTAVSSPATSAAAPSTTKAGTSAAGSSAAASSATTATTARTSATSTTATSSTAAATTLPPVNNKPVTGGTGNGGGVVVKPDPDWAAPKNCSGKAINGGLYWLGSKFINGPFDPSLCAAYAKATTAQNKQIALNKRQKSYIPCQMFNAYHLYINNKPAGTYCSLYNTQLSTAWATVAGQYSGRNYYSCRNSWTWSLKVPDNGRC